MSDWFLEISQGWDIGFGCSELESLGTSHRSLEAAWAEASDPVRLWLCARFADTHEARLWCLGTAAACATELLAAAHFVDPHERNSGSVPAMDVFREVLQPLQRAELPKRELTDAAQAMVHYYDVPRLLLTALHISERIERATTRESDRFAAGVRTQRARFARILVEAYQSGQAAVSQWGMSRGLPMMRWGTDQVRTRHRCGAGGASIEAVR